jgi:hypothetical protein
MLKTLFAAIGRALAWAAHAAADLAMAPVHAVLQYLYPGLYEPMPDYTEWEANDGLLPIEGFDPFSQAEEVQHAREQEADAVLGWAADAAYCGGEVPLPDIRPRLREWLSTLSEDEMHALVSAGRQALYGHIHFAVNVPGVAGVDEKGRRPVEPTATLPWDPTVSTGGFAVAAFARAG